MVRAQLHRHITLQFTPVSDQFGIATITVTVEDGGLDNDLGTLMTTAS